MTKNLAGTCKCFTLGLKEIRQLIIYQNSWLLISFQDTLVYFISVSISNVLSLSLRTCWWTTRSKSLRPTSTRPSARHRSCRNNWHTRREGAFRKKRRTETEVIRALDCWSLLPFLLQTLQTFHSVTVLSDGKTVHDEAAVGASVNSATVDYQTGCSGDVVASEPVINPESNASWELSLIYPEGRRTLSKKCGEGSVTTVQSWFPLFHTGWDWQSASLRWYTRFSPFPSAVVSVICLLMFPALCSAPSLRLDIRMVYKVYGSLFSFLYFHYIIQVVEGSVQGQTDVGWCVNRDNIFLCW